MKKRLVTKVLAAALIGIMAVSSLAGCSATDTSGGSKTTEKRRRKRQPQQAMKKQRKHPKIHRQKPKALMWLWQCCPNSKEKTILMHVK
ncbi:hypothetical protein [Robinsoniella peoriensis]|uniref:hypothetical protein n=1 Tax=Robinsoniella peoriensis TaxID=180332 RepID=UPI003750B3EF